MKTASVALILFIGSNCGIILSSSSEVPQVTETTTNPASKTNTTRCESITNKTDKKNVQLIESLKGDENEIYKTEGKEKNLDERSYVYIDQTMRRPIKKIFNMKLDRLTNSFMNQGYTSKRKTNVFPMEYQSREEQQPDQNQLFVPNMQPPKYLEQNPEENKKYSYQLKQEKKHTTQKIKEKVPTESKSSAPRPLSMNYESGNHRGIKHKLFGQHYLDHTKPKRKLPFARHRLNYNYGIASYTMRRSALRNQFQQNAEKDVSGSASPSYPTNDKYVQLLEEIGNVIDLDVDDVMIENVNENNRNNMNSKRVPCKNCFSGPTEPKQKSRTVSLLGCTCENLNVKHEPFSKIIKMLDDQTTAESASHDYSMM